MIFKKLLLVRDGAMWERERRERKEGVEKGRDSDSRG